MSVDDPKGNEFLHFSLSHTKYAMQGITVVQCLKRTSLKVIVNYYVVT